MFSNTFTDYSSNYALPEHDSLQVFTTYVVIVLLVNIVRSINLVVLTRCLYI